MARADSTIRVSIIGDVKNLAGALNTADKQSGGLLRSAVKVGVALGVVREGFDFIGDATREADRLGDALARLSNQIGPDFTGALRETADNFSDIGASTQDILEAEAIFADWATAAGIADPAIRGLAESVAATATALTLTDDQGRSVNEMLDLLDKAAGGSSKAAKELGVSLQAGLDPAAQMTNILGQLQGKVNDAFSAQKDLEGQQSKLQAQWETLTGQIGGPLSDALAGVVGFINDEIAAIPSAIAGWQMLGAAIEGFGRTALGPLGNVRDALENVLNLLGQTSSSGATQSGLRGVINRRSGERSTVRNQQDFDERNGNTRTVNNRIGGP